MVKLWFPPASSARKQLKLLNRQQQEAQPPQNRRVQKLCCGQTWIFLLCPLILLFLVIFVMTVTLPLPLPPPDLDRRSSRALSSAGKFPSKPRAVEAASAAAFQQPLPPTYSSTRRTRPGKETPKHSVLHEPSGDAASDDKNSIKARSHANIHRNNHRSSASKRKEMAGAIQSTSHHHLPQRSDFTVNNTEPKHRITASSHRAVVKQPAAHTHIYLERIKSTRTHSPPSADRGAAHTPTGTHTNRNTHTQMKDSHKSTELEQQALQKPRQAAKHSGKFDSVDKKQLSVKNLSRDPKMHMFSSGNLLEVKMNSKSLDHGKASSQLVNQNDSKVCVSFREQDFPDNDSRRIRVSSDLQHLPWFSRDDVEKMELLSEGNVISKARVPAHGQVLQVAMDPPARHQMREPHHGSGRASTHSERCQQGRCSLIKRSDDWFEVLAFHLDRVLGLNRSLPAVLRSFHSEILPYRFTSGSPRPAVWWDPNIQHLDDQDSDQNSVPLSWVQYQELLQARCGDKTELRSEPCVGVRHSEWGRLALFDFLLQVNDRLDRYCCGFTPDPTELCVENLLHRKCGNIKDLVLVHILVRKADPSRLVFIDNAGRPQQSSNNLNFRLVEGIDEFPERAVSVLHSGCLESLLLRSLYTDKEFWNSRGGAVGLRPLVHMVEERGRILLQHIRNRKLHLQREL